MTNITSLPTKPRTIEALADKPLPSVRIAPVLRADPSKPEREERRRTHQTATGSWLYLNRLPGSDDIGVLPPVYLDKREDLFAAGRRHPLQRMESRHVSGRLIWDQADEATRADPDEASAVHVVLTLPPIPQDGWPLLVERFCDDQLVTKGAVVDWAIHALPDEAGGWKTKPHAHLLVTARRWRDDQRRGSRQRTWLCGKAACEGLEEAWCRLTGLPSSLVSYY